MLFNRYYRTYPSVGICCIVDCDILFELPTSVRLHSAHPSFVVVDEENNEIRRVADHHVVLNASQVWLWAQHIAKERPFDSGIIVTLHFYPKCTRISLIPHRMQLLPRYKRPHNHDPHTQPYNRQQQL
ncbi:hypothetical protein AG1IA_07985 [Rhizoctonia solani AG-1 IA]|uniref:Uncharacterized protein n=1 Tax=Thanatephorus cucumeris (strain AG1-IA) TaxID=983506 RepID=L8WMI5_THACA|nr:hypothetical protein AG1IA_07985 [Rhizoctonia solani AG-1 IA]